MRIHGFNTRGFAQKSFRVPLNNNSSNANCIPLLSNLQTNVNFVFRNGGNDWTKTMLRDAFVHRVMEKSNLSTQKYTPVVCFFNGEYWGIHTLRERFDDTYIQQNYSIHKDSIAILELDGTLLEGSKSDVSDYKNLVSFIISNDMSNTQNYSFVEEQVDIHNLIEYYITNLFFVNNDWPHNNCKYWRYAYPKKDSIFRDHKWRYVLYDMDWSMGFNIDKAYAYNMFEYLNGNGDLGKMLNSLMKNADFRKAFEAQCLKLLENELSESSLKTNLMKMRNELAPWISEHINRWRVIGTVNTWDKNMDEIDEFISKRPSIFRLQLKQFLLTSIK
jgi:hypothetical protein